MAISDDRSTRPWRFDPRQLLWSLAAGVVDALASLWVRSASLIGGVSIVGLLAVMMTVDWLRPVHGWDMLAYLGVVARDWLGMTSAADIHAFAYDTMRAAVDPDRYALLTQMDAYRERMASDPTAFASMLGMYDVKWLYVALIAVIGPVTGYANAGYAINVGASVILATGLIWWLRAARIPDLGIVVPALLMAAGISSLAMADIPDFLAFSLTVCGALMIDRDRVAGGLALVFLGVLARPDMVAFLGVLMAVSWFWRDRMAARAALAFAAGLAAFVAIDSTSTNPGWWAHLWFSTYHMENSLVGFDPAFSLRVYVTAFAWNLVRSAFENAWLGLYVLTLLAWGVMQGAGVLLSRRRAMLLASLLTAVAAKFVVFPIHDTRFYLALLFPAMLLLVAGVRDHFRSDPKQEIAAA